MNASLSKTSSGTADATLGEPASHPSARIALLSIVAFWGLYFVLNTMRAVIIFENNAGLMSRAIVVVASMAITAVVYLVLRRVPISRLDCAVVAAALLAVPAALAYATVNQFAFLDAEKAMQTRRGADPSPTPTPTPAATPQQIIVEKGGRRVSIGGSHMVIENEDGRIVIPEPPAAPAPPVAISMDGYENQPKTFWTGMADTAVNGYFFFCCWSALYLALCYAGEVGRLARRSAALEVAARSAELRALRYQVNPHFLFNTLNSLSSLVLSGRRDEAEAMIVNLSTFFRTSLTGDPTEDVPLKDEIRLQRLYLDIEQVRFPDRLAVAIDLPTALERACVPGMILQPLFENAVKHGVSRARTPVTIHVTASEGDGRLVLRVENDGGDGPVTEGTGVGLANVRARLAARYGDAARCEWTRLSRGGFLVTLTMPLVFNGC